jgi:2-phosphosulfolactate phosphatase
VLAGEERCVPPPGFDLGNSPEAVAAASGAELVLATSNGTPAIVASAGLSGLTLLACLANLDAVLETLRPGVDDVLLVCSGTNGRLAIEDVYVAGRIVAELDAERTDAAELSALVAGAAPPAGALFRQSTNGRLLVEVGLEADIDWCVRESFLDVVPRVAAVAGEIATITADRPPPAGIT